MLPATRLIVTLAWRNVRHRPWHAALLLVALCLATTSLSLGLAVNETADGAWERLAQATNGFHVYVKRFHESDSASDAARARDEIADLADAPGVAAVGGPWLGLALDGEIGGAQLDLRVQVRDEPDAAVDQPLVTAGRWLDADGDGVVLEDGLASTLHVDPDDTIVVGGHELTVVGTAMTTSTQRYPLEQPALVWVGTSTAAQLAGIGGGFEWLELRLDDPADAAAFVERYSATLPPNLWELHDWQDRRDEEEAGSPLNDLSAALLLAGSLLAALTTATAAVLVAGRLAAQSRQVGTLKAVGVTPGQVTAVLLVESLAVAVPAIGIGVLSGRWLAPLLARSVVTLYGGPQAPAITASRTLLLAGVAVTLVAVATIRPSLRALRQSTLRALTANIHSPRQTRRATASSLGQRLGLPLHAVLALRSLRRRPGRLAINVTTLAFAVAMVVLALSIHRGWRQLPSTPGWASDDAVARAAEQDLYNELMTVVLAAAVLLAVLAAINTIITATFAARDNAHNHAILRALGATPRQTQTSFLLAQLGVGLLACSLGIPLGIVLFHAWAGDLAHVQLATPTLAAISAGTTLLYLLAAAAPARLLAAQPITRTLTHE